MVFTLFCSFSLSGIGVKSLLGNLEVDLPTSGNRST